MIIKRIIALAIAGGIPGVIYLLIAFFQTHPGNVVYETTLDIWFSFNSAFIWCYLSFFIYIPLIFFIIKPRRLSLLQVSFVITGIISGIIYFFYPTTLIYPIVKNHLIHDRIWNFLASMDSPKNCVPSLHASLTFICAVLFFDKKQKGSYLITLWAIAIILSIVIVRRHLFTDLFSGIVTALISLSISYYLMKFITIYQKKQDE